jgi:putative ABC transport system substrate-binding protein
MRTNVGLSILIALLFTHGQFAAAQQPKKIPRIGYLGLGSGPTESEAEFKQRLRDLGWVEGQNVAIEYRWAANQMDRLPILAEELVHLKVDVIVAPATPAVEAARKATTTMPIVMMGAADPVASGFVKSLAQPGGNITGLSLQMPERAGKWLELLKEINPKLSRVAFLAHGGDPALKFFLKETQDVAPKLGIHLQPVVIEDLERLDAAFSTMKKQRAGAVIIQPILSGTVLGQGSKVAQLAIQHRLPSVSDSIRFPEAGGLMSYGANRLDMFRRAAVFVDKILKGIKPEDIPVEQPMKFDFIVNLKTAKQIGITIPQWTLMKADRVIR